MIVHGIVQLKYTYCIQYYTSCRDPPLAGLFASRYSESWLPDDSYFHVILHMANCIHAFCTPKKTVVIFHQLGNPCGALFRTGNLSSVYPLMTLPMQHSVIIPSFMLIARTSREEFASRQKCIIIRTHVEIT